MSINKVVLLGKLISKQMSDTETVPPMTRAVIETYLEIEGKEPKPIKNFVVCYGEDASLFYRIEVGTEVYVEGKLHKNEMNFSEVLIRHFEVPNKGVK